LKSNGAKAFCFVDKWIDTFGSQHCTKATNLDTLFLSGIIIWDFNIKFTRLVFEKEEGRFLLTKVIRYNFKNRKAICICCF